MLKIDPYEPHVPIYARCAAPFWYWTITRITGVHCAANAPSWERQQRRISEIETIPTFDAKCSKTHCATLKSRGKSRRDWACVSECALGRVV